MGSRVAICVGINQYDNLRPLNYAQRDAEALRDFCLQEASFERVYFFAEGAAPIQTADGKQLKAVPTYGAVMNFLHRRFESPFLKLGDDLWFFFAGHGKRHQGHDYLMLSDSNSRDVSKTAISLYYIIDRLQRSGASNIVLMLDACRDVGDRAGVGIGSEIQKGVVSFYACSPEESSYEIEGLQHGSFTYALLQGLRGTRSTVKYLDAYLREQVPLLNRQHERPEQMPYTSVEPLAKQNLPLLPQKVTPEDVDALKLEAFKAERLKDHALAEQLWIRVLNVLPGDLDAIDAIAALRQISRTPQASEILVQDSSVFRFEVVTVDNTGQITDRRNMEAEYRREELRHEVGLDLVVIPGGKFLMGSVAGEGLDDEWPQHEVRVSSFLMGKYPVTQSQWKAVASLPKVERDVKIEPSKFKGDMRPVECITWYDAMEFCARLSKKTGREYRLPTEAEWEYACRSGTTTPFYVGEFLPPTLARYKSTFGGALLSIVGVGETSDVGSFPPNAFGLYDMQGNVWEWCLDHWHKNYHGAPSDGSAWVRGDFASWRVLRGGSWNGILTNCRAARRLAIDPVGRLNYIGFRVVCSSAWPL
jgi:formylglycine-generating enzyme required for sulfatase activity